MKVFNISGELIYEEPLIERSSLATIKEVNGKVIVCHSAYIKSSGGIEEQNTLFEVFANRPSVEYVRTRNPHPTDVIYSPSENKYAALFAGNKCIVEIYNRDWEILKTIDLSSDIDGDSSLVRCVNNRLIISSHQGQFIALNLASYQYEAFGNLPQDPWILIDPDKR